MDVRSAGPRRVAVPQRRYVSILFADLVGSTEISDQLDPEDLGVLMTRYQHLALATMERYGGFVARFSGDGVLVYFGYPVAHENDGERAVRAGLELIERLARLTALSANKHYRSLQSGLEFTAASLFLGRRWGAPAGSITVLLGIR